MGRTMALDLGAKRIGAAISDELGLTAQPLTSLPRRPGRGPLEDVAALARTHGAERIVVGLPLSLNGSEGPAARRTMNFVRLLRQVVPLPVETWDERLTTVAAQRALRAVEMRPSRRKKVVDIVAAQLILQSYLDHLHRRSP